MTFILLLTLFADANAPGKSTFACEIVSQYVMTPACGRPYRADAPPVFGTYSQKYMDRQKQKRGR